MVIALKRFLFLAPLVAFVSPLAAQPTNPESGAGNAGRAPIRPFWKAELPGGNFVVSLAAIRQVSSQQYVVDGAARVTEVNVDTGGQFKPRFYFLEPLAGDVARALPAGQAVLDHVQGQAESAAAAASPAGPVWSKVVKNYPTSTHAGTVEFRLESLEQLDELYRSVERAWVNGRGETFTLAGTKPFRLTAKKTAGGADGEASENSGDNPN